ncbi:hypothetical protein L209DRAFT_214494 [Thermothelomyces heterothallicus CBS 203.75]
MFTYLPHTCRVPSLLCQYQGVLGSRTCLILRRRLRLTGVPSITKAANLAENAVQPCLPAYHATRVAGVRLQSLPCWGGLSCKRALQLLVSPLTDHCPWRRGDDCSVDDREQPVIVKPAHHEGNRMQGRATEHAKKGFSPQTRSRTDMDCPRLEGGSNKVQARQKRDGTKWQIREVHES